MTSPDRSLVEREAIARLAWFMVGDDMTAASAMLPENDAHWDHWKGQDDAKCVWAFADHVLASRAETEAKLAAPTEELVGRLRARAADTSRLICAYPDPLGEPDIGVERSLLTEAADHLVSTASKLAAAVVERDEARQRLDRFDFCMCGETMVSHNAYSNHAPVSGYDYQLGQAEARTQAAEARLSGLVEGLERIASFQRARPTGDPGSYQRGYDIGFNNSGLVAAGIARTALQSARGEGEGRLRGSGGALADVAAERQRQIEAEGWAPEHDDEHRNGELATAAACYAAPGAVEWGSWTSRARRSLKWPWDRRWWKPKGDRRDLVRAAALIIAEIERLDRVRLRGSGLGDSAPRDARRLGSTDSDQVEEGR